MNDKWVLLKRDPRLSRRVLRLETRDGVRGAVVKVEPKKAAAILTASDDGGRWFPLGELAFIPQFVKGDVVICIHGVEPKHRGIVYGGNHEYSKVMWDDGRTFGQKNIELLKIGNMSVFEIPEKVVDPLAVPVHPIAWVDNYIAEAEHHRAFKYYKVVTGENNDSQS